MYAVVLAHIVFLVQDSYLLFESFVVRHIVVHHQHCHKNYFITEKLPKLSDRRTANSIRPDNTTAVTTVPLHQIEATEQQEQTHPHGR